MSAYELFRKAGVSKEAYQEFLRPTLLVGVEITKVSGFSRVTQTPSMSITKGFHIVHIVETYTAGEAEYPAKYPTVQLVCQYVACCVYMLLIGKVLVEMSAEVLVEASSQGTRQSGVLGL
jgi:hypothetical protein